MKIRKFFKILGVFAIVVCSLTVLWLLSLLGGVDYTTYPWEKALYWICEEPHFEIHYSDTVYDAYLEWEGEKIPVTVGFHSGAYIVYRRSMSGNPEEEEMLLQGCWKYKKDAMVFEIGTDNLFNGAYAELVFLPECEIERDNALAKGVLAVSSILLGATVIVRFAFGKKVSLYLERTDAGYSRGIVPNRWGILFHGLPFLALEGIVWGLSLMGLRGVWLIGLLMAIPALQIIITKQTTYLTILEGKLYFRGLGCSRGFEISDVTSLQWVTSGIFRNRCLVITITKGFTMRFEQENFWGLEEMYAQLSGDKER